jgi:glutamate--cysteine ligase
VSPNEASPYKAAAGPTLDFERLLTEAVPEIEHWFRQQWQEHTPPFYASVDLRNAGYKLAPVDTNLFPGGFNNLAEDALPCAVQAAQVAVERVCPDARRLLLIPERHTRNTFYLSSVARLARVLASTGLEVRLGTLSDDIREPTEIAVPGGESLRLEPLERRGRRLGVAGFDPCVILLNNDLSAGLPPVLNQIDPAQTLLPPLQAGWAVRRKSQHFGNYDGVVDEFARLVGFDPWLINPYFSRCDQLDFREPVSQERLAAEVDRVLGQVREKYREHGISQTPFVVVKADAGTYGMGIMMVRDASEVITLNRKQRNKMAVVKEGLEVSEVIIQEGVPTFETLGDSVAEPVVYMIDRYVVGGFYRVHPERGIDENLNAPGMHFVPLPFHCSCNLPEPGVQPGSSELNRHYVYGVVGRLALLAASLELEHGERSDAAPGGGPLGFASGVALAG